MPLTSSADLERFFLQGENEFSIDKPWIVDRYSIPIVAGIGVYTLPDYITSIRRITWFGIKLDPLPQRNYRDVFQSAPQAGQPFWYIYDNLGLQKIQLFPTPIFDVAAGTTDLWGIDILTCVIVEYYRSSLDPTFVLPTFCRRQFLKNYVAKRVYEKDGNSGNPKLASYYSSKWGALKIQLIGLFEDLTNRPRKLVLGNTINGNTYPGFPILPPDQFGTSVDTGE